MYLTKNEIEKLINKCDLTLDENYCMSIVIEKIKVKLHNEYNIIPTIERGSKIISLNDNYYSLGYNDNDVTLGTRYTKYIDENNILRTQMSSVIPSLLKHYEHNGDKLWLCPGIVYRRDIRDKTHVGEPHQMDIWYLTKKEQKRDDLLNLVKIIISVIEEIKKSKIKWRYTETCHNYTDNGIEVEIYHQNKWLEILECGLISRKILINNNLENYSGLALGLGLERLIMIIKEIDDIRILYSNNTNILNQLSNLNKYKPISNQPSIKRDLSIAINKLINEEELTELILSMVDIKTQKLIESINIINETPYESLPNIAIQRLGMNNSQKNILLRITLRDLETTITNNDANTIYSNIYKIIHKGDTGYFL